MDRVKREDLPFWFQPVNPYHLAKCVFGAKSSVRLVFSPDLDYAYLVDRRGNRTDFFNEYGFFGGATSILTDYKTQEFATHMIMANSGRLLNGRSYQEMLKNNYLKKLELYYHKKLTDSNAENIDELTDEHAIFKALITETIDNLASQVDFSSNVVAEKGE